MLMAVLGKVTKPLLVCCIVETLGQELPGFVKVASICVTIAALCICSRVKGIWADDLVVAIICQSWRGKFCGRISSYTESRSCNFVIFIAILVGTLLQESIRLT